MTGHKLKEWLILKERSQNWFAKKIGISPQRLKYWIDNNLVIKDKYIKKAENIIKTY